ncbi:MAG: phospholipase D-like domain-containing protein [Pseudobdellovibrionaceae bacterium]
MRIFSFLLSLMFSVLGWGSSSEIFTYQQGAVKSSQVPHVLRLLKSGSASLYQRLELIRRAERSIETEYYILKTDTAGRIYTRELIKASQRGVKVRILVDSTPLGVDVDRFFVTAMRRHGIEVKLYNDAFLLDLVKTQHRTHRKLLIIDGEQAITGGRNIADEYFDLSTKFNFLDRDVYIKGPIVTELRNSFEYFWNTKISESRELVLKPRIEDFGYTNEREFRHDASVSETGRQLWRQYRSEKYQYEEMQRRMKVFPEPSSLDLEKLALVEDVGRQELEKQPFTICEDTFFAADLPGFKKESRVLYQRLRHIAREASQSLVLESPYVVITGKDNLLEESLARGVQVKLLTNSLYSSDNALVASVFYSRIGKLIAKGAQAYIYSGDAPTIYEMPRPQAFGARWGIHSKTAVIDGKDTIISTFNLDPRSKNINAELAVICRNNPSFAEAVLKDIEERIGSSVQINEKGKPIDGRDKYFKTSDGRLFMYHVLSPLAHLFDFLL